MEQSTELLIADARCSANTPGKQSAMEDAEKDDNKKCCQIVVEENGSKLFTTFLYASLALDLYDLICIQS